MTKDDYYSILGVAKTASKDDIKKVYKQLAKKYHPDVTKEKGSEEKFKEISEAYAVLSDDQKRAQYNQFGHATFEQQFSQEDIFRNFNFDVFRDMGFGGFDNIFDMFFGGQHARRDRGSDIQLNIKLSFEEAAFGAVKEVDVERLEKCEGCNGSGAHEGKVTVCKTCKGQGQVRRVGKSMFGMITQIVSCGECNGRGKKVLDPCKRCRGQGFLRGMKTVKVTIPAGVDNGMQIRLEGEGDHGEGGGGDVYLVVHVLPHEKLTREGYDLFLDIEVPFSTLVLGGKVEVPTVKGSATVKIPPGTQSHAVFRLKGEGIKKLRGFGMGDQFVQVVVKVPKRLSKKQERLLHEFDQEQS